MLWKKRIEEMKKIIGLSALMLICLFVLTGLKAEGTAREISSSIRQFIIRPGEEAIYVVSISDEVPVPEMETISGNTPGSLSTEAGEVFAQVNRARAEIGLSELVWSDELAAAAEIRAQEIHQSFSHTRPDGSPWWTANGEIIYGENIAKGYQSAESVLTAWMESSDHKENILYSGFETIGIAVYNVDGKWYWAQEFGY